MQQLNIGLITSIDFNVPGGIQKHTIYLGKALKKLGHQVIYFSPSKNSPKLPQPHVNIGYSFRIPTPNGSWSTLSLSLKSPHQINHLIQKYQLDLLHFQESFAPQATWHWLKHSSIPNFVTFHIGWNYSQNPQKWSFFIKVIKQLAYHHNIKATITVSPIAQKISQPLLTPQHYLIPPAININPLRQRYPRPPLTPHKKHLLFIGSLVKRKGCQHLLQALQLLPQSQLNQLELNIIGYGKKESQLIHQTKKLKLNHVVNFLGPQPENTKYAYLQYSDLFIAPTTDGESFGMVLIEALTANLPIIAGNNDAYKHTLKNYPHPEYILDPTNYQLFADKIIQLLYNHTHQQNIKTWAKSFVTQFSAINIAKKHLQLYRSTLKN